MTKIVLRIMEHFYIYLLSVLTATLLYTEKKPILYMKKLTETFVKCLPTYNWRWNENSNMQISKSNTLPHNVIYYIPMNVICTCIHIHKPKHCFFRLD